ncbi:MAG: SUMF1/EgtB/PvdO family nonheme iron enzyme [Gammaproteobacteria bacterium]|nr:SUMF1/EgtB/PvdO family nonheme iron enzyme [Gammaproteobacteria bacterium]
MARPKVDNKKLRWTLIAVLAVFIVMADWYADGVGPRLILGSATLNLTSDPDEARVFIDGEAVGRTPMRELGVRPGERVVRLEHRFHDPVAQRLDTGRGDVRDVHVDFAPATGSLEIVSNPRGAQLVVNGEKLEDASPVLLSPFPTGAHEVSATIHGRQLKTQIAEVLPRQQTDVSFELERVPMSELYVSRSPGNVKLEVGGKPYQPGMTLPIGTYKLRAASPGYESQELSVELVAGRNDRSVRLVRLQGSLSLAIEPGDASVEVSYPDGGEWRTVPYEDGMTVPTGPVRLRASAVGHRNYERRLTMQAKPLRHAVRLEKYNIEPGRQFRDALTDGGEGPLVVIVPTGTFRMGSDTGSADERPVRAVSVSQPFAIGVHEITREDFARFKPSEAPDDASQARLPITRVSWRAAQDYAEWLSEQTGNRYRLPSEAEWEYAARAGTDSPFHFGSDPEQFCAHANIADATFLAQYAKDGTIDCSDDNIRTAAVGTFKPNAFGIHDMLGNVEEWVVDCWHDNYRGAPSGQEPRTGGTCATRILRGGAWDSIPGEATVSYRTSSTRGSGTRGFRVVREL